MKLQIPDIPEDGLRIRFRGEDARWDGLKDFSVQAAPSGHLFVQRRGQDVLVQGEVHMALSFDCSRCLETFPHQVAVTISQMLRPEGSRRLDSKEIELAPDDLEYATYSGRNSCWRALSRSICSFPCPCAPFAAKTARGCAPVAARIGTTRTAPVRRARGSHHLIV